MWMSPVASEQPIAIDHVLIVSRDLAATAAGLFERTGLAAIPGGVHDGLGTRNVIVPLGNGYLELVEAYDEELARANPFGRLVLAGHAAAEQAGRDDILFTWSVAVDDAADVASRLDVGLMSLARAGVSVQLAGVEESVADPARPFFLQRAPGQESPASKPAHHLVEPLGFTTIRCQSPASNENTWVHEVPTGTTEFTLTEAGQPSLVSVDIGVVGSLPIVLTADQALAD